MPSQLLSPNDISLGEHLLDMGGRGVWVPGEVEFRAKHLVGEPSTQEALRWELGSLRTSFEENQAGFNKVSTVDTYSHV